MSFTLLILLLLVIHNNVGIGRGSIATDVHVASVDNIDVVLNIANRERWDMSFEGAFKRGEESLKGGALLELMLSWRAADTNNDSRCVTL